MAIAYLIIVGLSLLFTSIIWSTNGFANVVIKMFFIVLTIWTAILFMGQIAPLINTGAIRLI